MLSWQQRMSLKVATLNVHNWKDANYADNVLRLVALTQEHDPDVLCFQECGSDDLHQFLSLRPDYKWKLIHFGCAIVSKLPLEQFQPQRGQPRMRAVIGSVAVKEGAPPVYVASVHLDYRIEPRRITEEHELASKLSDLFATDAKQIWAGDFNALTRSDYTDPEWDRIASVRMRNSWESPQVEVMENVRKRDLIDCWESMGRRGEVGTCRFDTRIDYVFTSKSMAAEHPLVRCEHVQVSASDHNMVLAEFEL